MSDTDELTCLDSYADEGGCEGEVTEHPSLAGTGLPIARCDKHWTQRLERQREIDEAYPDSPIAPSWFDPANAGEYWDDDY